MADYGSSNWDLWDDSISEAEDLLDDEIADWEAKRKAAEEALARRKELLGFLAGERSGSGPANAPARVIREMTKVLASSDTAFSPREAPSVQDLLAGKVQIKVTADDGVILDGLYDFEGLFNELVSRNGSFGGVLSYDVGPVLDEISEWQSEVETIDPNFNRQVVLSAETNLAPLQVTKTDLDSGDETKQAEVLQRRYPAVWTRLSEADPPAIRTEKIEEQIAAVKTVRTAPATEPFSPEIAGGRPVATVDTADPRKEGFGPGALSVTEPKPAAEGMGFAALGDINATAASMLGDQSVTQEPVDTDTDTDTGTDTTDRPSRPTAAEIQAANKDAVYDLLAEEFGGFSFFLKRNDASLMVGLTADGSIVAADDANAATVKSVLDVIVDKGLTDFNRIQGVLKNTQWWQDTDAQARDFDIRYGDMSDPEQLEYLESTMDILYDQADYLGFELTAERARENAELLMRAGDSQDEDAIREMMGGEQAFSAMGSEVSEFAARRKEIQSLSAQYFVPISDEDAARYAEQEYLGVLSAVEIQNMFKEQAIGSFGPAIESAINAGFTTEQYFAPYKYEIEKMLDRPNINLYEEFGDVIEYMPDTGGEVSRPMTLGETRKYVRGLDEWQTSSQGQDSARSLAFAIGKTFGEVA